jgi:hypothetical protein
MQVAGAEVGGQHSRMNRADEVTVLLPQMNGCCRWVNSCRQLPSSAARTDVAI